MSSARVAHAPFALAESVEQSQAQGMGHGLAHPRVQFEDGGVDPIGHQRLSPPQRDSVDDHLVGLERPLRREGPWSPARAPSTKGRDAKPRASMQVPHKATMAFFTRRPLSIRSME